jgi:phosphatidate cytidylyltransferase
MTDDGTDPGWGAGSSAYARLRRLNDDEDAGSGGFFDRSEDRFGDSPAGAPVPPPPPTETRNGRRRRDRAPEPEPSRREPDPVRREPTRLELGREEVSRVELARQELSAPESAPAQAPTGSAATEEAPRSGRRRRSAGRNVPVSILVGLLLAGTVLGVLFYAKQWFIAVLVVAACVGIWELVRAIRSSDTGANPPAIPLMVGGAVMLGLAWFRGVEALSLGLLITVLAVFVWRLADGPAGYQRDMGAAALITVYVPFLLGFAAPLATPDDGEWRILTTLAAVVLSDTGGFVAGVLFGKHPMAPTISPKKSWEGFAGSIVAAAIGGALLMWKLFDVAPWWGAVFGGVVAIACVLGDLAESLLKRDLGIKDMSNLLPGHGGLMDRLDSILFALPTAYLLFQLLAPPA